MPSFIPNTYFTHPYTHLPKKGFLGKGTLAGGPTILVCLRLSSWDVGLSVVKSRESPASQDKLAVQQTDMNGRIFSMSESSWLRGSNIAGGCLDTPKAEGLRIWAPCADLWLSIWEKFCFRP